MATPRVNLFEAFLSQFSNAEIPTVESQGKDAYATSGCLWLFSLRILEYSKTVLQKRIATLSFAMRDLRELYKVLTTKNSKCPMQGNNAGLCFEFRTPH